MELLENSKIESIDLFYLKDDKEKTEVPFTVTFRKPSMAVRTQILELTAEHMEAIEVIDNKYPELQETALASNSNSQHLVTLSAKRNIEYFQAGHKYTTEYFKSIINYKPIPTHLQQWLMEKPESDFWQMQNFKEMEQAVIYFRTENKI